MAYNNKRQKPTMFKRTVKLGLLDSDRFAWDNLLNVLSDVTFELVNVNLTMNKAEAGFEGNGFISIGFVNKFYSDESGECVFDVAISDRYRNTIKKMESTENTELVITIRAFTDNNGKIIKITGLDLRLIEVE